MATIKQRGQAWYIQYTDPQTGQHVRRSLGKITRADAERVRKRVQQQTSAAAAILSPAAAPTLSQFAADYLAWHAVEYPSSHARIAQIYEQHIDPALGHKPMDSIEPLDAERLKATRRNVGAKTATVNKELQSLKAMLNRAIDWNIITANPLARVRALRNTDSKPPRWYTAAEMLAIYAGAPNHEHIWRLLANAGLRRTEVLQLERSQIKSDRIEIISAADSRTKSGKWREVPLNDRAGAAVKALKKAHSGPHLLPLMNPRSLSRAFDNTLRRAKLDGSLHCLRHTYCSHLVMAGVPLRVVQTLAGHANHSTTEKYAHLAPDQVTHHARAISI